MSQRLIKTVVYIVVISMVLSTLIMTAGFFY
ncbi:MAG: stressosome-associated protein Prli42 [Bacillaceae bacterium]|nr:stressosome-associated protein Prli42 [Bacillaceae bacterium]